MKVENVKCSNCGKCFAKTRSGYCRILESGYADGKCPFQKEKREITNGVLYPYNPDHYKAREGVA